MDYDRRSLRSCEAEPPVEVAGVAAYVRGGPVDGAGPLSPRKGSWTWLGGVWCWAFVDAAHHAFVITGV
jgi:hypothetical protein